MDEKKMSGSILDNNLKSVYCLDHKYVSALQMSIS